MPTKLIFRVLVLAGLVLAPARAGAGAIELGLTADHVYSLWTNINSSLLLSPTALPPFRPCEIS